MKKIYLRCWGFLLFFLIATTAYAQKTVTGTVTESSGLPLPGVSVTEKGTKNGTATNSTGKFTISVKEGSVLVFTSIGLSPKEVTVGASSVINVTLSDNAEGLEEVVVTALGVKRDRKALGYATSTVKGDDLVKAGVPQNPFVALYGKAAGVGINIGSGGPTGGVNVNIRGAATLTAGSTNRPLFVVDGVPLFDEKTDMSSRGFDPLNSFDYGSGINDLNAEDIESIDILKGAKATVLYGGQGLNGVVLITTKSGKKTKGFGITVSQQVTFDKPFTYIDFQNEYGSGTSQRLVAADSTMLRGTRVRKLPITRFSFGPRFDGSPVMLYDSVMGPYQAYPNNFIDFFRTAISPRTNVAVSGGGQFGSMRASYTNNTYKDVLQGFNQRNNTLSFNGSFNISPLATVELVSNLYSVKTKNRRPNIQGWVAAGLNRDYDYNWMKQFYRDADGYKRDLEPYGLAGLSPGMWAGQVSSILWDQNDNSDTDNKFHTVNSLKLNLQISKEFSLISQASLDYTNTDFITENKILRLLPSRQGGKYNWIKRNTMQQQYQSMLKFEKDITNDLNVFAFAGGSYLKTSENRMYVGTGEMGLLYPDWFDVENADYTKWPGSNDRGKVQGLTRGSDLLYSVFGSGTVSWKNTYYVEFQGRNDWSSTLVAGNRSYFYPGVSFSWNFSNTLAIPKMEFGKLRLAWADVGGHPGIATGNRYFADRSFQTTQLPYPNGPIVVDGTKSLFTNDIKPFRKREFEVGFDSKWFKSHGVELDFSFYTNNIYNQIVSLSISPTTGWNGYSTNTGNTKNWGFEVFLKGSPLNSEKFRWDLSFTAANQYSKVVKLTPGLTTQVISANGGIRTAAEEGKPNGELQGFDYKRDDAGNQVVDANGRYVLDVSKYKTLGNINPKLYGGVNSDFFVKGFNVHIGIDYKFGGTVFSYSNNYLMGNGVIKASLPFRDESQGGMAYYIDNTSGQTVAWQHNQPAPAAARDKVVYHDGMILNGVKEVNNGGNITYVKNDIITSAVTYYQSYLSDNSTSWPPDRLFKNDYIKLREISLSYTLPKNISEKLKMQKLTVTAAARNLGYLHKTLPNVDAEAALGAQGYIENSFYPSTRTFSLGLNLSF